MMDIMKTPRARAAVLLALDEDMGSASCVRFSRRCDATSEALVDPKAKATGEIYARVPCVVSGATVAAAVLKAVDRSVKVQILKADGSQVKPNETILQFTGRARSILAAERTALNFMQRMCATATLTKKFVDATKRYGTLILDTRKTTPGLRYLEKEAVALGGGMNHRIGLFDMILLKDNHVDFAGGITNALTRARDYCKEKGKNLKIEIEVRNFDEINEALATNIPDRIMLDNFTPAKTKEAVELIRNYELKIKNETGQARHFEIESSGGITIDTIRDYALQGVDFVSVGALTHSYKSLDMSFKAVK